MPLSAAQIAILRTELQTDPRGYGYNFTVRNDSDMAARINAKRDGTNPPTAPTADGGVAGGAIKFDNATVDTGAIRAAITKAAYDGLTTGDRAFLNWLTSAGNLTVGADLLQSLAGIPTTNGSIWSTGTRTAMNAAMESLLRRFGSRAEEKFGRGVSVTIDDVAMALNQ